MPPLFVYGTLRCGSRHPNATRLAREATWLGRAVVRGRLWRVAHYPGLVAPGSGIVRGDLFRLHDEASLSWLDAYEMCGPDDPRPHCYARAAIGVRWRGRTATAATYLWVAPTRGLRAVRGGDWLATAGRARQ